jgi:hypothetical protein
MKIARFASLLWIGFVWVAAGPALAGGASIQPPQMAQAIAQSSTQPIAQTTPATPAPSKAKPASMATPAPQVNLISAGTGDRQLLRIKPTLNSVQRSQMTMEQAITTTVFGQKAPNIPAPTTQMLMETTVTKLEPNGHIHYQFRYTNVEVVAKPGTPETLVTALRTQMQQLTKLRGFVVVNDRNQIQSTRMELPDGLRPEMRQVLEQIPQSLNQFSSVFPEAAIGVGAKWQTVGSATIAGINLTQTSNFELVQLANGLATVNVTVDQQAPTQRLSLPTPDAKAVITLKSLKSAGTGQMTINLQQVLPAKANLAVQSENQVAMSEPGATSADQALELKTELSMQFKLETQ